MSFYSRSEITKRIKKLERKVRRLTCVLGCLKEYNSHEDAADAGVRVGQVFVASDSNTMGITPGALVTRKEI